MNIKRISKRRALIGFLLIVFFTECHFLRLVRLPESIDFVLYTNRAKWIGPTALLLGLVCMSSFSRTLKPYHIFLKRYLAIVLLSVIIVAVYSFFKYPLNSLMTTYGFAALYLYVFFAPILIYLLEKDNGIEKLLNILTWITIVIYIVSIIDGIYFSFTGSLLLTNISEITGSLVRNGKIRLGAGAFSDLVVIYHFYQLFNNRKRWKKMKKTLLVLLLCIVHILYTGQTRAVLISIGFALMILIFLGDGNRKKKVFGAFIIGILMIALLFSGKIGELIATFSSSNQLYGGSTIARMGSWKYYFDKWTQNPIFGIGFAGDENYYNLVHGDLSTYFQGAFIVYDYSDCGFVGQLAKMGIFAFAIYLYPLIRYSKVALKMMSRRILKPGALLLAMIIYLYITSVSLIVLDSNRMIVWPIIISIFEYYNFHYLKRHSEVTTAGAYR